MAAAPDRSLLRQWLAAFELEALGEISSSLEQALDRRLQQNSLYLWQNETPVTMVGGNRSPADAAFGPMFGWIAPVYTPPEQRCRGYATAATAAVSQHLLEQGCHCCFLLADLHNPTANHIYQKIGYQPICEWHEYEFSNSL